MTDRQSQPYAAFRLNLEQQHKRAKDLLKAAKAGRPEALRRLHGGGFTAPASSLRPRQSSRRRSTASRASCASRTGPL